jgi:hypothetical protein
VPWPAGPTSNGNLQPACRRDHRSKHAAGFAITEAGAFRTRAGFLHPTGGDATQPVGTNLVEDDLFGIQHSAAEIRDALVHLAALHHAAHRPLHEQFDDLWSDVA